MVRSPAWSSSARASSSTESPRLGVLEAMRADPVLADIPVVEMTAGSFAVESGPTPPGPAATGLRGVRLPEEGTDVQRHSP
jgi:hypothetical protein